MARAKGKDQYFSIEDAAGTTLRNISPYVNSVSASNECDMLDITCLGAEARAFDSGLTNATFTIGGVWDDTADVGTRTVLAGLYGLETSVGFEYGPEGNASGAIKESGECFVQAYNEEGDVGGMVMFTATIQVTGAKTVGTFSP